jgi:hypothetical protein
MWGPSSVLADCMCMHVWAGRGSIALRVGQDSIIVSLCVTMCDCEGLCMQLTRALSVCVPVPVHSIHVRGPRTASLVSLSSLFAHTERECVSVCERENAYTDLDGKHMHIGACAHTRRLAPLFFSA